MGGARIAPASAQPRPQSHYSCIKYPCIKYDANATFEVTVSPLAGRAATCSPAALSSRGNTQIGFMKVDSIRTNSQGGEGWWPDVCLRVPFAFAVAGLASSVWFTLRA